MAHALQIGHADRLGALDLAARDGLDTGADDLAHIGAGVEAERDDAAFEFVEAAAQQGHFPQAEIDHVNLDEQRGGANRLHVGGGKAPQYRVGGNPHDGGQRADGQGQNQGHQRNPDGRRHAAGKIRPILEDDAVVVEIEEVHARDYFISAS